MRTSIWITSVVILKAFMVANPPDGLILFVLFATMLFAGVAAMSGDLKDILKGV